MSWKRIAAKSVFKEYCADSTKIYRRRYTDRQVMAKAGRKVAEVDALF